MGCCPSKPTRQKPQKILLLGSGESGKSTVLKQMKILHKNGFTMKERQEYKNWGWWNIQESMVQLYSASKQLSIPFQSKSVEHVRRVVEWNTNEMDAYIATAIKEFWEDPAVALLISKSHEFYLQDSTYYFMHHFDRILLPTYLASNQDILHSRARTTGIISFQFQMGSLDIEMIDVGGQRIERRNWASAFPDSTFCVFCVSLIEWDMRLDEDSKQNRLKESLVLFENVVQTLGHLGICLFLNKWDLFAEKVETVGFAFEDYDGPPHDSTEAVRYILSRFVRVSRDKSVYPYITTATDTKNIKVVFKAVKDNIMRHSLETIGVL